MLRVPPVVAGASLSVTAGLEEFAAFVGLDSAPFGDDESAAADQAPDTANESAMLADIVRVAEAVAPTRPHPAAGESALEYRCRTATCAFVMRYAIGARQAEG